MKLSKASVSKSFLKEPFIFDFGRFAKQTFSLAAVVAFICALFLFSGVFLDATAESERADVLVAASTDAPTTNGSSLPTEAALPQVSTNNNNEQTPSVAAEEEVTEAYDAVVNVLGGFIGITPFNEVSVGSWDVLRSQVGSASGNLIINITSSFSSQASANQTAINVPANAHITIRSNAAGIAGQRIITQYGAHRHFVLGANSSLTLENNIILCGFSTGTFVRQNFVAGAGGTAVNWVQHPPMHTQNDPRIGGGVDVTGNGAHLILATGSEIRRSTAELGGGVRVAAGASPATLTLLGGSINNNAAIQHGGGVQLAGTGAVFNMHSGQVNNNEVVGRVFFPAAPPHPESPGNGVWNWPGASGSNFPAMWAYPQNVSRGGGGVAVQAGASFNIAPLAGVTPPTATATIGGNHAERGGGVYVTTGTTTFNFEHPRGHIVDNTTQVSYHRPNSAVTFPNPPGPPSWLGSDAAILSNADLGAPSSGSGAGVHLYAGGSATAQDIPPVFTMTDGQIARNSVFTMSNSGGGGVSLSGARNTAGRTTFNMSGGVVGGSVLADANTVGARAYASGSGAGVRVAAGAIFNMTGDAAVRFNNLNNSQVGGGVLVTGSMGVHTSTLTMRNDSIVEANRAGNSGGGVDTNGIFRMYDNASVVNNRINPAGAGGGGVNVSGGTVEMRNLSAIRNNTENNSDTDLGLPNGAGLRAGGGTITLFDSASIHNNRANANGGGVLLFGSANFIMNNDSTVRNNNTRNSAAGLGGGGAFVEGSAAFTMNDNSSVRDNTAGQGNGGGIFVSSTATGAAGRYGLRVNAGSITDNQAPNGHGGGVYTTRHLYRSPLVGNPLLAAPFSTATYTIYDNLRVSNTANFSSNTASVSSYPPIGGQLTHIANQPGSVAGRSTSFSNRLLNNHDINYRFAGHDFWFTKEDTEGNALEGVTFEMRRINATGALVPGSPANTPPGTLDGQRVSLSNGLVGFPLSITTFGSNYNLREVSATNPNVFIPQGHWNFMLPSNRFTGVEAITEHGGNPVFQRGADGMWRVSNIIIQAANLNFFKTDMSIYQTPPQAPHPRLAGAVFALYQYTPQSASTQFADRVPASDQPGYNYWTLISGNITNNASLVYALNFPSPGWAHVVDHFGPQTRFHLVEVSTPDTVPQHPGGFVLPTGQWRFDLNMNTTTNPGHADFTITSVDGNPEFRQIGTNWYVGNEPYNPIVVGTGLVVQNSNALLFIILGVVAIAGAAGLAVRHRKNIEELSKLL